MAPMDEKTGPHKESFPTNEHGLGHAGYHEKDGLRNYADSEDHNREPPVRNLCILCEQY